MRVLKHGWLLEATSHAATVHSLSSACRRTFGQTYPDIGSLLLGNSSTRTTESHYCRRREDTATREVLELFDPEKSRVAEKPLIENEGYLSGYA